MAYSISPPASSSCITYKAILRVITVACNPATLTDIYNQFHDNSILSKQSPDGVWFLNANLVIAKGATFHIDSGDTKWLKMSSDGISGGSNHPYSIDVHGSLKIDSVKITSWDPTTNYYAITNGTRHDAGASRDVTVPGAPRPFITVEKDSTGTTDITNSEIAYLGYEKGSFSGVGTSGLNFYGGDGSVLSNDNIHDLYFGFYSSGVGGMIIEKSQIYHNTIYGLDPHTGTHDMIIRNNVVHDNGQFGIICSLNCNNVTIENNHVYNNGDNNTGAGIMFSRNMINSIALNNNIHDESVGISISGSHENQIYNNTISSSGDGIDIKNSTTNRIHDNTVINSTNGLDNSAVGAGAGNIIYNNHFIHSPTGANPNADSTNNQHHPNHSVVNRRSHAGFLVPH
jgi:parallel beta-helix repeat protein